MIDSDDHARQFGGILAGQILAMIALASGLIEIGVVEAEALIRSLEMQREKFRIEKVPADMLAPMDAVLRALREEHRKAVELKMSGRQEESAGLTWNASRFES